jgi:hypothetical protein
MAELRPLQAQIDAQIEMLRTAARFLDSAELADVVGGQLNPVFRAEFARRSEALAAFRRALDGLDGEREGWSRLEKETVAARRMYQRLLGYIQAELFRSAGLDEGMATIADAFLGELARVTDLPWRRQVLMGGDDLYEERTELVLLRFPQYSIWQVPVMAHELGHFAATRIRDETGATPVIAAIAEQSGKGLQTLQPSDAAAIGAMREGFLHELFADTFATYVLGPAFACCCLLLALNPAVGAGRHHPSSSVRARAVLACLGRLNQALPGWPFAPVLAKLKALWPEPASLDWVDVAEVTGTFVDILRAWLPPEAQWGDWLEDATLKAAANAMRANGAAGPAVQQASLRTLLNAAWSARLDAVDDHALAGIGRAAHRMVLSRAEALSAKEGGG